MTFEKPDRYDIKYIDERYDKEQAKIKDNLIKGLIFVAGFASCWGLLWYIDMLKI